MRTIAGTQPISLTQTTKRTDVRAKVGSQTSATTTLPTTNKKTSIGPKRSGIQNAKEFALRFPARGSSREQGLHETDTPSSIFLENFARELEGPFKKRQAAAKCPSQEGPPDIDHPRGVTLDEILTTSVDQLPGARSVVPLDRENKARNEHDVTSVYRFGAGPESPMPATSIFKAWDSISEFIYYGGSKSEGQILAPSGNWIDEAHRNGTPILGTMDFQTDYYGGETADYDKWLTKDATGQFVLATKFVDWARQNGFDGWLFSFETPATDAQKSEFPEFFSAMKSYAESLDFPFTIAAYGAAINGGGSLEQAVSMFSDAEGNLAVDLLYVDTILSQDAGLLKSLASKGIDTEKQIRARLRTDLNRCNYPGLDKNDDRMQGRPHANDQYGYWLWGADDYNQDELVTWLKGSAEYVAPALVSDAKFSELLTVGKVEILNRCRVDGDSPYEPLSFEFGRLKPNPLQEGYEDFVSVVIVGPADDPDDRTAFLQSDEFWSEGSTVAIATKLAGRETLFYAPSPADRESLKQKWEWSVEKGRRLAFTQEYSTKPGMHNYNDPIFQSGTIRCDAPEVPKGVPGTGTIGDGLDAGQIGAIVGATVAALGIAATAYAMYKRRRAGQGGEGNEEGPNAGDTNTAIPLQDLSDVAIEPAVFTVNFPDV